MRYAAITELILDIGIVKRNILKINFVVLFKYSNPNITIKIFSEKIKKPKKISKPIIPKPI
ncbi:MAG: hypothetical protein BroJett005_06400 [Ignavibacteriota bacterium]|nr:MAG: hypothetical protein BroJett005_06400 [Ignavibacteriota bacterium]